MIALDLTREARAHGARFDVTLDDESRAKAIVAWQGRMANEHISARVFAALVPQLLRAGASAQRQADVAAMIAEELSHAVLCAAMVHALGGEARVDIDEPSEVPTHDDVEPLEGLLRNVLSISCLSETVAVALIDAERLEAGPPAMRDVLRTILADEVGHARVGWQLLAELAPRVTKDMRARLGDYLAVALGHLEEHELAHLPAEGAPSREAELYGVCDGPRARMLFYSTVHEVILPALERNGLPGRAAWERRDSAWRAVR